MKDGWIGIRKGYKYSNLLKNLGFKFSKNKKMWFKKIA
jgi:hypothetical protein